MGAEVLVRPVCKCPAIFSMLQFSVGGRGCRGGRGGYSQYISVCKPQYAVICIFTSIAPNFGKKILNHTSFASRIVFLWRTIKMRLLCQNKPKVCALIK